VPRKASLDVLRKVLPQKAVNAAAARSDLEGGKQAAFHGACIAATAAALWAAFCSQVLVLEVAAFVAHAFVLSFLFMPLHEAVHGSVFRTAFLNKALAWVAGTATMRPPRFYLLYHYQHHKYTGDPEKDPELAETLTDFSIDNWANYLLYLSSLPFWYGVFTSHYRHAMGNVNESFLQTPRAQADVSTEARQQVAFYVVVLLVSAWLRWDGALWYWLLPTLAGQPFLRFYLLAEHHGCSRGANMLLNTRTTATFAWYRRLAWNMPYHAEHHAWPGVPFHGLPAVHRMVLASPGGREYLLSGCDPTGDDGYIAVNRGLTRHFTGKAA